MPSDMMEEYALSLILTGWDQDQEWAEIWQEGNDSTVVWESFDGWEISELESFATALVEKLRDAYDLALEYEGRGKR